MQKPDAVAKVAAFVVVLSGSAGVGLSCASRSFELLTASAALHALAFICFTARPLRLPGAQSS